MEQECAFVEWQPYPKKAQIQFPQTTLQKRFHSQQQSQENSEDGVSSSKSERNAQTKDSQFRNFAKHYAKTIKNIIKNNIKRWPLNQINTAIAIKIVETLENTPHPPKKMIDAIFSKNINTKTMSKVGYEELVQSFSEYHLLKSCQIIRELTFSQINSPEPNVVIGQRIVNRELFLEYLKEVTRIYESHNRFSFRLRPKESRNIRKKVQQRRSSQVQYNQDRLYQVFEEDKYFRKFAQQESNFLG